MLFLLSEEPAHKKSYVPRQVSVGFDSGNRVAAVRVRYQAAAGAQGKPGWKQELRNQLEKKAGLPVKSAQSPVWADLARRAETASRLLWQDDVSALTAWEDGATIDVTLQRRTADTGEPAHSAVLEYLPQGPVGCLLGTNRHDLLQKWHVGKPILTDDGALVLQPEQSGAYDALLVWFDHDVVSRVVARHVFAKDAAADAAQAAQALLAHWQQEAGHLGWPSRQDTARTRDLQCIGWHDGRTRIRSFWQAGDKGEYQVFTEWRSPVFAPASK
jgi:hypothetical protein